LAVEKGRRFSASAQLRRTLQRKRRKKRGKKPEEGIRSLPVSEREKEGSSCRSISFEDRSELEKKKNLFSTRLFFTEENEMKRGTKKGGTIKKDKEAVRQREERKRAERLLFPEIGLGREGAVFVSARGRKEKGEGLLKRHPVGGKKKKEERNPRTEVFRTVSVNDVRRGAKRRGG